MPNNGLQFECDKWRFKCRSTATFTNARGLHFAECETTYATDVANLGVGIAMRAESRRTISADSWLVTYSGPGGGLGGYSTGGAALLTDVSIWCEFHDVKVYGKLTGSLHRVTWSEVELFVNGSSVGVLASSSGDVTSAGCGPNYVPIFGLPLHGWNGTECESTVTTTRPTYDCHNPGAGLPITADGTVIGTQYFASEFYKDGAWVSCPVSPYSATVAGTCHYSLTPDTVSASTTADASIEGYDKWHREEVYVGRTLSIENVGCLDNCTSTYDVRPYRDDYSVYVKSEKASGEVWILPDLAKAIDKLGDAYRSMWLRLAFPEVTARITHTCIEDWDKTLETGTTTTYTSDPVIYAAESQLLSSVTNAAHAIEDVFTPQTYAPVKSLRSIETLKQWDSRDGLGFNCPIGVTYTYPALPADESYFEWASIQFPFSVGSISDYRTHADDIARYCSTWAAPHWGFFRWRDDWDVDGSPATWDTYWAPGRQQYNSNVALPESEHTNTRNDMQFGPGWDDNGNEPFQTESCGGFAWIGAHRFPVLEADIPATLTLSTTRPGDWSSDDCTITPGVGGLTLSGLAATNNVDLTLGSWTVNPFMLLHLAKQVTVGWGSNVAAMSISVIAIDGQSTVLGTTETTYDIPAGSQLKQAGSWAIDNGCGIITNTGVDVGSAGISAATMADPERALAFMLGKGRQFRTLRFSVTPTNTAVDVVLDWPVFTFWATHPVQIWESGKCAAWVWADGPGIRWGNWMWWDATAHVWHDPPLVAGLGTANTIVDALAFAHRVITGDGGANLETTVDTEGSTIFDSYETDGSTAVLDKFSDGVPLPKGTDDTIRFALINWFSEVPPMPMLPRKERDSDWAETGAYANVTYDHCQEPRRYVANVPLHLFVSGVQWTADSTITPPSSWHITEHMHAIDNTETGCKIRTGSTDIATVRPFEGAFALLSNRTLGKCVSYHVSPSLTHALAYLGDGNVWVGLASNKPRPLLFADLDTGIAADWCCIQWDRNGRLWLWTEESGAIKVRYSDTGGGSWSMGRTIAASASAMPAVKIAGRNCKYAYWVDGSAIKGEISDLKDNVIGSTFTAVASGVDADAGIDVDESTQQGGAWGLTLWYFSSGSLTQVSSVDGRAFA